jgi:hypothetical protein
LINKELTMTKFVEFIVLTPGGRLVLVVTVVALLGTYRLWGA